MKEFMMIFIGADYAALGLSPEELQDRMGKWFAWSDKLQSGGILRAGDALHAAAKRISGPGRVESDGPFVESKELIGGYFSVTADSMEEATEIARDYPDYDLGGTVEIREIVKFER